MSGEDIRKLAEELHKLNQPKPQEAEGSKPEGDHLNPETAPTDPKTPLPEDVTAADAPREVWSERFNSLDLDFEAFYDSETGEYHLNDAVYKEGAKVWMELELSEEFGCNLDSDQPIGSMFTPELVPLDSNNYFRDGTNRSTVSIIPLLDETGRPRHPLPNEADFIYALSHCADEYGPGFYIFCREGKFYVLTSSHYYAEEYDREYLICVFNARKCKVGYRKCWATLNAEVEATVLEVDIRYIPGYFFAWTEDIVDEMLEDARRDPYPDEFDRF